ncbi:hypothetical protein [Mycobacterium celatum]|uniref:Uncharacterized protein n=1 Tax=Mycobacterium celatum TaxID=28045 RepID=A0A2G5PQE9_MYCCE|nr:hypothetical protein [Mycobacterium celatum]PIB80535.1 hypothetical protein CQY23_03070 [Mycobacterium celatum]
MIAETVLVCAAAVVLVANVIALRRRWRPRRAGLPAPGYTLDDVVAMRQRLWDERERRHVKTTIVYDEHGEPVAGFDSRGLGAVCDFETGEPE